MSNSAYSNSGDQNSASNGQTSMQMPQYMHSEKSIAKRSSTLRVRSRAPGSSAGHGLLVRVDVDAPVRALARAQHADGAVLLEQRDDAARLRGGSSGCTSGYCAVTERPGHRLERRRQPLDQAAGRSRTSGRRSSSPCASRPCSTAESPPCTTPVSASCDERQRDEHAARRAAAAGPRAGAGSVTRSQITTNASANVFASVHSQPELDRRRGPAPAAEEQRPRSARDSTTIPAYSASRKSANRSPVYSVYGAEDDLGVGDGMSNGGRVQLGQRGDEEHDQPTACQASHHGRHASTMPDQRQRPGRHRDRRRRPARAAARRPSAAPPLRSAADQGELVRAGPAGHQHAEHADTEHRQHEEQPEVEVLRRPRPAPSGIATSDDAGTASARRPARAGRPAGRRPRGRCPPSGRTSRRRRRAAPSRGTRPAYIGPSRACMCAITLCSVCPTSSGRTRKATSTTASRSTIVQRRCSRRRRPAVAAGPRSPGPARRAAASGAGPAAASSSDSPGSLAPGHGLADPRGEHEVLAQRRALEAVRQQQRHAGPGARRSRCRTSRASRARASAAPRKTPGRGRQRRRRRPAPGCAPARARGVAGSAEVARPPRARRSSSSTADSQSKKSQPELGRGAVSAVDPAAGGDVDGHGPKLSIALPPSRRRRVAGDRRRRRSVTSRPGRRAVSRGAGTSRSAAGGGRRRRRTPRVPGAEVLGGDLLLQLEDAVQQRLRPRRAARHVDVDRDDLVDALRDAVGVPVRAAAVGAGAERDDVLGLGHLLVEPPDGRRHLVGDACRTRPSGRPAAGPCANGMTPRRMKSCRAIDVAMNSIAQHASPKLNTHRL